MNEKDLTLSTAESNGETGHDCLFTDEPCTLVPVQLRRMILFPGFWIGWSAVIALPLARPRHLVLCQYGRMFRPWVGVVGAFMFLSRLDQHFEPQLRSPLFYGLRLAAIGFGLGLWIAYGFLLDQFEFVRLLRYNTAAKTVRVRFSTTSLAERAREQLGLPNDELARGKSKFAPESDF